MCDPRMIMFVPVPYGITYTHTLESLVNGPGRENLRAWAAEFDGLSVFTISFDTPKTGNHCEYDVAPSRGYNIVRWRLEWGKQGVNGQGVVLRNTFDCLMTCKLKQVADGVWFPSTVELDQTRNDKPYSKEVLKIQVLSLNQRMDEKLFTLAGLPPDVLVIPEPPISQDPRRANPAPPPNRLPRDRP